MICSMEEKALALAITAGKRGLTVVKHSELGEQDRHRVREALLK